MGTKIKQCHQCGRDVRVKSTYSPPNGYVCGLYPNCSADAKKPARVFVGGK